MTGKKFLIIFRNRVAPHYKWTVTDAGHLRGTPRGMPEADASYCPLTATVRTLRGFDWRSTQMMQAARALGLDRNEALRIVAATDDKGLPMVLGSPRLRTELLQAAMTVAPY